MKKNNIFRLIAVLITGLALAVVSCTAPEVDDEKNENGGGKVDPVFPTLVEKTVEPGDEVSLTASPDLDWEISVPQSTLQWFWIQDGAFKSDKCSGKAGEQVTVVIGVSETEEFDTDRTCEVTMKMGGESKVIAKLKRLAKEKTLAVYVAKVVDGEIQFVEDGSSYDYGSEEATSIDLIWTGTDFRLPIKVESNYDWTVRTPEWASVDVPETSAGVVNVNVYGVPSKYPEDAASGKIQFMGGDVVVKEYDITIPGCSDIFSYSITMGLTELNFNFSGQIKTSLGYTDGPVSATVSGTSAVQVFAVGMVDGKYDISGALNPEWLSVDVDAYDASEGADVLQSRNVTISAALNEGEDRLAMLFFLPPEGWTKDDLFTETKDAVKDEYKQYAVPVVQHSSNQEFIQMLSDASVMAEGGATFAVSEDEGLYTMFGQTRYAYELLYNDQYARDNARMFFTSPVTSAKVFDEAGTEMTTGFLTITLDEDMCGGVIDMIADARSVGYVVLYGTTDNVLAVVRCTYDPQTQIGEVSDVAFIGESANYAEMVGATLEHLTEGTLYNQYKENESLVYHLTYRTAGMPMKISIPNSVVSYTVNPWNSKNYIRVNDVIYDEVLVNGRVGGIELIDGGIDIYMEMPEGRDYMRGNIIFSDSEGNYALVIICTLDLRGE
ncbi:MAG: hypothetical protein E7124_03005 [Bacteroidales bacterium]|nr:hypothetical protein [Bacteroidales bacterium]